MKKLNVYGIELTELENMKFSKWVSNEGIAMNTKTEEERKQITSDWLKSNDYGTI
jgi:hypothetical protein